VSAPELPREIQVEVTAACNLRCRMCLVRYRPPQNRVTASLPFGRFRDIVDALPELERVTLQGLGEPLMAPDLFPMIAYARARGIAVGFNTNATLLTRRTAERLVDLGLAWLCVSVDGARPETYEGIRDGARLSTVERHVRGLVDVMRARGARAPVLELVFVAMRRNVGETADVVRLAADWGIDRVRVQSLSHSFGDAAGEVAYREIRAFTLGEALWAEEPVAFADARRVADELGVTLRLPETGPASPRAAGTPGCDWPWRSTYLRHDGRVQPCCMLMGEDRAILGDVAGASLTDIWRNDRYAAFRAALRTETPPDVCRGCAMYRGVW
jgi:radical SAM protein with 4Fe4S-binding SPASM domain